MSGRGIAACLGRLPLASHPNKNGPWASGVVTLFGRCVAVRSRGSGAVRRPSLRCARGIGGAPTHDKGRYNA